ncbi:MAG: SulP family inorganic anion transporter, partial [Lachnospiraceae bacterium]|nr:SulP family inorganic anion transporter [Lachnospiraceae bacterium]
MKHKNEIFGGIVVGLVSIPISMGYAQIAGLPPVYGLYGSLLPILLFGVFSSSKQFMVGVDA